MQSIVETKKAIHKVEDLYFTDDHEWIDFQGSVAYIGVSAFKLTGIRKIDKVILAEIGAIFKANDIIASFYCNEYKIEVHMPVRGRLLSFNEELISKNYDSLIATPENQGWIALIGPSLPYDRTGLVISKTYQLKRRSVV